MKVLHVREVPPALLWAFKTAATANRMTTRKAALMAMAMFILADPHGVFSSSVCFDDALDFLDKLPEGKEVG